MNPALANIYLAMSLRASVQLELHVRVKRHGDVITLLGVLVLAVVVDSQSKGRSDAAVDYRQFPVLLVVDLLGSDEHRRSGEHGSDPQCSVLVADPSEEFPERPHLVHGIPRGGGVARVIVGLVERLFPELRFRARGKGRQADKCQTYPENQILHCSS